MIHWLRLIARLLTASYALWRSRYTPLLFFYFVVQTGDTVAEETIWQTFGDGTAYFWTYGIGSGLICLFALWIAWDSVPGPNRLRKVAIPAILALTVARMTALECAGGLNPSKWLILTVGAILFFCGVVLTTSAVYAQRNHTALFILGGLWLSQAFYFDAYLLQSPEWQATGYWLPALLVCAGFLLVGYFLKPPKSLFPLLIKRQ